MVGEQDPGELLVRDAADVRALDEAAPFGGKRGEGGAQAARRRLRAARAHVVGHASVELSAAVPEVVGERPGGVRERADRAGSGQQQPAPATPATPCAPRMRTNAPAPTLGPIGSRPRTAVATRTAVASNTEASTPTARRRIQLRRIWAIIDSSTKTAMRARCPGSCRTLSPRHHPASPRRSASRRSPSARAAITAKHAMGSHHGRPSGPTKVKVTSAASAASTRTIGTSVMASTPSLGVRSGATRRKAATRMANPSSPLTMLPR